MFEFLEQSWKDIDIKSIKRLSKDNYKAMISRTPDRGSFRKNPLRISLAGGMLWLSVYDAMEGKMNPEQFGEMVRSTTEAPMLKKHFHKQKTFDRKTQKKKTAKNKLANSASDCEFNWNTELILVRDENEYAMIYHRCGLCALGKQEHHEELIPYMCALDYEIIAMLGGVLKRKGTIATCAERCDFYLCKKGSKWDT